MRGNDIVSEDQNARKDENVQYQTDYRSTILQCDPAQPRAMHARDEKGRSSHEAECQEKAEPVDELGCVRAQVGVDLLVLLYQQVVFAVRHVADSGRTMFMAQHIPTAAPFMNGSSIRHIRAVTGSQIAVSSQIGGE